MGTDGTASLDQYLKPIVEHKIIIGVIALAVTLLGLVAAATLPASYEATAVVLVSPVSADPTDTVTSGAEVDVETELRLVTSNTVIDRASERLGAASIAMSPTQLADSITASTPKDSRIIDIDFSAGTPELAQAGANAVADSYIAYRSELAEDATRSATEALNQQVATLKDELAVVENAMAAAEEGSDAFITAAIEQSAISRDLDTQQAALGNLNTISSNVGRVVDPAQVPAAPSGLGTVPIVLGALIGGLVLGCLAAFALSAVRASRSDDSSEMEVRRVEQSIDERLSSTKQRTVPDALLPTMTPMGDEAASQSPSGRSAEAPDQAGKGRSGRRIRRPKAVVPEALRSKRSSTTETQEAVPGSPIAPAVDENAGLVDTDEVPTVAANGRPVDDLENQRTVVEPSPAGPLMSDHDQPTFEPPVPTAVEPPAPNPVEQFKRPTFEPPVPAPVQQPEQPPAIAQPTFEQPTFEQPAPPTETPVQQLEQPTFEQPAPPTETPVQQVEQPTFEPPAPTLAPQVEQVPTPLSSSIDPLVDPASPELPRQFTEPGVNELQSAEPAQSAPEMPADETPTPQSAHPLLLPNQPLPASFGAASLPSSPVEQAGLSLPAPLPADEPELPPQPQFVQPQPESTQTNPATDAPPPGFGAPTSAVQTLSMQQLQQPQTTQAQPRQEPHPEPMLPSALPSQTVQAQPLDAPQTVQAQPLGAVGADPQPVIHHPLEAPADEPGPATEIDGPTSIEDFEPTGQPEAATTTGLSDPSGAGELGELLFDDSDSGGPALPQPKPGSHTTMSIDDALGPDLGVPSPAKKVQSQTRRSDLDELVAHPDYTNLQSTLRRLGQSGLVSAFAIGESGHESSLAVGLGLAEDLKDSGAKVLVVDMMIEAPTLHHLIGVPGEPGLTDVLAGRVHLADVVTEPSGLGGIKALTVGTTSTDPVSDLALVNRSSLSELLMQASGLVHAVVLLGGGIDDAARHDDALAAVGGMIIGTDEPAGLPLDEQLTHRLAMLSVPVLGLISINDALSSASRQADVDHQSHAH